MRYLSRSSSNLSAKQAKAAVAINDIIAVTKTGYLNYRVVGYNSDTSGIADKDDCKRRDGNGYGWECVSDGEDRESGVDGGEFEGDEV